MNDSPNEGIELPLAHRVAGKRSSPRLQLTRIHLLSLRTGAGFLAAACACALRNAG